MMKRLKSSLLEYKQSKWYDKDKPYNGIIFFEKENYLLEVFEVENGKITKPYCSPCQQETDSTLPLIIDSSKFCNDDQDIYGSGAVPQLYQNNIYHGMSYTFTDGKCDREIYTDEDGLTDSQITWDVETNKPIYIELHHYHNKPNTSILYFHRGTKTEFRYKIELNPNLIECIDIEHDGENNTIQQLSIIGNILKTKHYVNTYIELNEIFKIIENYEFFNFGNEVCFNIDTNMITILLDSWINHNAFQNIEHLIIQNEELLNNLLRMEILGNYLIFPKLTKITLLYDNATKIQMDILKKINPNLSIKKLS